MQQTAASQRLENYRSWLKNVSDPTVPEVELPKADVALLIQAYDEAMEHARKREEEVVFVQNLCTQWTDRFTACQLDLKEANENIAALGQRLATADTDGLFQDVRMAKAEVEAIKLLLEQEKFAHEETKARVTDLEDSLLLPRDEDYDDTGDE